MSFAPSGRQLEISFAEQSATIVELGGGIRRYEHGRRAVLEPYAREAICDAGHGQPLIPWPNRIAGGRYSFEGSEQQLALTEPAKGNAIHGLLRWRPWEVLEQERERVVVGARLLPMTGYPFALEARIAYSLGEDGLRVQTTVANLGPGRLPFGSGQHPYLSPGEGATVDDCALELPAATRLINEAEHQVPVSREGVQGTRFDFRAARAIAAMRMDDAFTDLLRGHDGLATARLHRPDGARAELWVDGSYRFLEVFTGDTLAPGRARHGLGLEPMTCAPNAFCSGDGLLVLDPGQSTTSLWGARLAG